MSDEYNPLDDLKHLVNIEPNFETPEEAEQEFNNAYTPLKDMGGWDDKKAKEFQEFLKNNPNKGLGGGTEDSVEGTDEWFSAVVKHNQHLALASGIHVNEYGVSITDDDQKAIAWRKAYYLQHPEDNFKQIGYKEHIKSHPMDALPQDKPQVAIPNRNDSSNKEELLMLMSNMPEDKLDKILKVLKGFEESENSTSADQRNEELDATK